ncbi:MAG: rod-binding protein [Gallionella sp.]
MVTPLDTSAQLAIDANSLDQLRAQAQQSPDKALKAVSKQFESLFINMMLKSMREATTQDGMFDNEQTRMFTGMLDQQLSQNMASRGIGLAEIMVRQLSAKPGDVSPSQSASGNAGSGIPRKP